MLMIAYCAHILTHLALHIGKNIIGFAPTATFLFQIDLYIVCISKGPTPTLLPRYWTLQVQEVSLSANA